MTLKRVVVTGIGALTPIGNNVPQYWESLVNGVSGCDTIRHLDTTKFKTKIACQIKGFDVLNYMDRKEAKRQDLYSQFAMVAADEAILDAGIDKASADPYRIGVIWSSGIGGLTVFEEEVTAFATGDGTPRFNPFFIPKMISDIAAGHISIKHGFSGPNYAPVAACASSTIAIIDAFNLIRLGKSDIIVTGGSEAAITNSGIGGFSSMKAMSERNDDPKTASRPYDKDRDGFVMGEGAGAVVLESLDHALARGAKIYCEVGGGGLTADAYHLTAPHPEGLGVIRVMEFALEDAGLQPTDIDYINTHGTSTPLGDGAELTAIEKVFGAQALKMNISSTKSMTGHLLGAAGAIEAVAAILAIQNDTIPPTINNFELDPAINPALNLTLNKAQKRTVRAALSNTFGFGGHNAAAIFKKYDKD
jgi:3-oxoacyl-[acyl-carrier-protein] synthase II